MFLRCSRAASDWIAGSQQQQCSNSVWNLVFQHALCNLGLSSWMSWFSIVSVIFFFCDQRQKKGFTSPVKAVNYTAPVWKLRHTPGSCLIWAPAHEWALVSSWGWWKLLILRTGQRMGARAHCYQRDLNDLCWVKKQHSASTQAPFNLPLLCKHTLRRHTGGDNLVFYVLLSPAGGDARDKEDQRGF